MPLCQQIYNGLTIDADTRVRPCCHIDNNKELDKIHGKNFKTECKEFFE